MMQCIGLPTRRWRGLIRSAPLLSVDGVLLGVQLLRAQHGDERLTATARWIAEQHCGKIS